MLMKKNKMKKKYIILILLVNGLLSFSQDIKMKDSDFFLNKITEVSKTTTSIEADFKQEKTVTYLKDKVVSVGKFYTQNGNMRWEQTKPYSYIMLLSESGVKIKDDGNEKQYGGMANKFMTQIHKILLSSVNGDFKNSKDFNASYFENNKFYIVKLIPTNRRLTKMFEAINLSFDKTTYRLKILIFVHDDGESKMFFSEEKFNNKLSTDLFTKF